ncbi:unnamed protein product [Dovyalis caffra]|uniref:Sulfotransferase n=1 Tax=Dovyalis caffra TaxID=77055 RepID=A0AAV1RW13_9ROSI|nr:unnamed protein product [Dovyalis caffra]
MAASSFTSLPNEGDQESQGYQTTYKRCNDIIPTLPRDTGWWLSNLCQYQGFWLSSSHAILGLMLVQDHFMSKPTDIILATSPKCGTTWLRALIFATINRTSYDFATHPLLTNNPQALVPFLEGHIRVNDSTSFLESLPSPRFLSTHIPYSLFPDSMKTSGPKFVYVCRNPKDVLVSKWKFAEKMRPKEMPPLSLQDAFELFCNGVSHYGPFWDHVLSYWKASLETPETVLFLIYEDMKREPLVQVKRLAEFLGKPFSPEEEREGVVQEIVRLCSFKNLSTLEVNKSIISTEYFVQNPYFFRKGEVGDWENHLTPEMVARLDQITKEKLEGILCDKWKVRIDLSREENDGEQSTDQLPTPRSE